MSLSIQLSYPRSSMKALAVAILLALPGAETPEARALYDRALTSLQTRTREGISEARTLFRDAAEADPGFAPAHAGLADASCLLALYGYEASANVMPGARDEALEAIRLDPALARAHASLGLVRYLYEWSFGEAKESFERAIALDPMYPSAHHWFAMMLMATGRYERSLEQIDEARRLEPESVLYDVKRGTILMAAGRLDEAESHLRAVLEKHPDSPLARREMGLLALSLGRTEEALENLGPSEPAYAIALGRLGRKGEVVKMLSELEDVESSGYVSPIDFAIVYLGLGDEDRALDEIEHAYEARDGALVYLRTQPGLAPLREQPRFQKVLKLMQLEVSR